MAGGQGVLAERRSIQVSCWRVLAEDIFLVVQDARRVPVFAPRSC